MQQALQNTTSTSVSMDYTVKIDLPDVTICNRYSYFMNESRLAQNYFKRVQDDRSSIQRTSQRLGDHEIDLQEWVALMSIVPLHLNFEQSMYSRAEEMLGGSFSKADALERLRTRLNGKSLASAFRAAVDRYAIKCEETFVKCALHGRYFDCCSSGFMTMIMTKYGPCWATNRSNVIKPMHPESDENRQMLQITMKKWADPGPEDFTKKQQQKIGVVGPSIGVSLGISQWSSETGNVFYLFPNSFTSFGLYAKKIMDIPSRKNCATNDKLQFFTSYTIEHCSAEKAFLDADKKADCKIDLLEIFDPEVFHKKFHNKPSNRPYCHYFTKINSTSVQYASFPMNMSTTKIDPDTCPNLCYRFDYSYSIVRDVAMESYAIQNKTGLQFRYQDQSYLIYEQVETLAWFDYLSLVGGIWGIWMGSSLLTLIQVAEIPIWLCIKKPTAPSSVNKAEVN